MEVVVSAAARTRDKMEVSVTAHAGSLDCEHEFESGPSWGGILRELSIVLIMRV